MLKLILLLFISISLYANIQTVKNLQYEFTKSVLETNIFRERYNNYLEDKCGDDLNCIQTKIDMLKQWDTVQNDNKLWYKYKNKSYLFNYQDNYWSKIQNKLKNKDIQLDKSQFVSVVDLEKQIFIITLWDHESEGFYYIGKDYISSGDIYREAEVKYGENHYLKTPSGVFRTHKGWRSDGKTSDDNRTLGYGNKNRYVFYFGKQESVRYNTFDKEKNKIKDIDKWRLIKDELEFAIHAHESSKPMGQPYSHGCIRMTDELNRFLDSNSILHKNMFRGKKWLHKYSKSPTQSKHKDLAGEYLIIFDKI